ncbi:MAG: proliferating cell nuclear antigen (pcna) [Candidatus Woesearchaeota archaeon]
MKFSLSETKYLKDSIGIIAELVSEARFRFTEDMLEMVAMDPANVAMVIYKLFSSTFTTYEFKEDMEIGINLGNLKQVLKRAGSNDSLEIDISDNKFNVKIIGKSTRTFSLPLLDMEERQQKIPELKFPVKVTTSTGMFSDAIDDADIVGESVAFLADPAKLTIAAEGDLSRVKVEIPKDENTEIKYETENPVKAKYSIEYLKKMIQGSKISSNVSLRFNTDYPLKVEFIEVDKVYLGFILAPRVEND